MKAKKLLKRFVDLYGEVPLDRSTIGPGHLLWRDYYKYARQHMILTREGWEPGDSLASYAAELDPDDTLRRVILDEVNWSKGDRKYPRIFPKDKKLRKRHGPR